jgi:LysR family transcriptional activator of nhaA
MINFKHLHYFWMVGKEGSIARASERLHITPQTISGQISLLEEQLGDQLFAKAGRKLQLTDTGRLVMSYADEIFALGSEMEEMVRRMPADRPLTLRIGIADVVPKTIAYRLIEPAMNLKDPVRIICKENSLDTLLADLSVHRINLVIADGPIPPGLSVRGYNHFLGECGVSFLAVPRLARRYRKGFPASLDKAPLLLPSEINMVQPRMMSWLEAQHIHPRIIGEFDDSALMKVFGESGKGIFVAPTAIAEEISDQYGVQIIGSTEEIREQFYAISAERRISHPAIVAITTAAREWLK